MSNLDQLGRTNDNSPKLKIHHFHLLSDIRLHLSVWRTKAGDRQPAHQQWCSQSRWCHRRWKGSCILDQLQIWWSTWKVVVVVVLKVVFSIGDNICWMKLLVKGGLQSLRRNLWVCSTLINRAGRMTIAPSVKYALFICYWISIRIRLCDAPRRGIPINSGATSPGGAHEDKREAAFCIRISSRYGGARGGGGGG